MERPAWAPRGIDISVPSVSRIYDYYLGGSHNFEVDREAARKAMEFMPGLPAIMKANRAFMRRAVKFAVEDGVTQFLDIGSGIPTYGNVHEVAQAASPGARVLYVDHDPVAVAHSRAVLQGNEHADVLNADLREPERILKSPAIAELLDLGRPVGLLLMSVLHFLPDEDEPYRAVAELRDALAPGSLIALSHASYDGIPVPQEQAGGAVGVYTDISSPLVMRTHEETARFFDGFDMIGPGLVSPPKWRPESASSREDPYAFAGFAGVGRKG
ncbi:SAM-dependent methyltransferase [Streptomyces sp. NPDC088725]|uniref:SAM-dependent methyltransferase n=1 Tax=Streptomyces sp. NPDC088725 TaxID=3365873 RepID=UPI00380A0391